MIQCFVKKEYAAPFGLLCMPRLFSVSRTDEKASAHPRVMHAHDDLVEVVLVRGGGKPVLCGRHAVRRAPRRPVHLQQRCRARRAFRPGPAGCHGQSGAGRPCRARPAGQRLDRGGRLSPVCHLCEAQTVRLARLYDVLYDELTAGNDDGAHHLLMAVLSLVQQFRAAAARWPRRG